MYLILLLLAGIFVNNYVLSQFLGICPFLGVSKKVDTAAGMGVAVIFVIVLACAASWLVYNLILVPLHIEYLYNIAFILVIASLVQFVEMFLKKAAPALYQAGRIPAPDHNKLCSSGCCRNQHAERIFFHRIHLQRYRRRCWFRSGNRTVRWYP